MWAVVWDRSHQTDLRKDCCGEGAERSPGSCSPVGSGPEQQSLCLRRSSSERGNWIFFESSVHLTWSRVKGHLISVTWNLSLRSLVLHHVYLVSWSYLLLDVEIAHICLLARLRLTLNLWSRCFSFPVVRNMACVTTPSQLDIWGLNYSTVSPASVPKGCRSKLWATACRALRRWWSL